MEARFGRAPANLDFENRLTARALAVALAADAPDRTPLVSCTKPGLGEPLVFCDGAYGSNRSCVPGFAALLQSDRPVYSVHAPRTVRAVAASIESHASACIRELNVLHPVGPVYVGGYCNGGLLAWELTRQLRDAGRGVRALILVETISLNARGPARLAHGLAGLLANVLPRARRTAARVQVMRLAWILERTRVSAFRYTTQVAPRLTHAISRRLARHAGAPTPAAVATTAGIQADAPVKRALFHIMLDYLPPPLDVGVQCLQSTGSTYVARFDPAPWRRLAPSLGVASLPGDHWNCIATHTDQLAHRIAEAIASVDPDLSAPAVVAGPAFRPRRGPGGSPARRSLGGATSAQPKRRAGLKAVQAGLVLLVVLGAILASIHEGRPQHRHLLIKHDRHQLIKHARLR